MCGRFDRHSELDKFVSLVNGLVLDGAPDVPPSYNVCPSRDVVAIGTRDDGGRRFVKLNWGLVPSWSARPDLRRPINARIETAAEKPMFRAAFARHRCLVPCDGYYEWAAADGSKQPFYFTVPEGLLLAAIHEHNSRLEKPPLETVCLLTRDAPQALAPIHDRMPVILRGPAAEAWLDPEMTVADLAALAREDSEEKLAFHPVSTFVNSPANDSPRCVERQE